jgi:hypothetical protein
MTTSAKTTIRKLLALGLLATLATSAHVSVAQPLPERVAPPPPPPANKQFDFTVRSDDPNGACKKPMIPENGGNLQTTLPVPGPRDKPDHRIIWSSAKEFSLLFEAVGEPGRHKPVPPVLGDERNGAWNDATLVKDSNPKRYEFRLPLKTGKGNETVEVKYTVTSPDCAEAYDPVIIVGR